MSLIFFSLSQLKSAIPSDLKRLNQCLCQTTSQRRLATADIIHLFLLTNLSIHSREMKLLPFFLQSSKLFVYGNTDTWRLERKSNVNSTSYTEWRELRGDVKVAQASQKRSISGIKYWCQIHSVCKGGNQPGESLLWFNSICINPPNYAFNKWSSPRELPVHSRLAYSRQHNHQLV